MCVANDLTVSFNFVIPETPVVKSSKNIDKKAARGI